MKMYVLIRDGLIALKLPFFLTKNLTHNICIKECLFIQFVMVFFKLHFKSRGLGSVSVLINIFLKIKNNVMFNSRNVPYLSFV